MDGNNEVGTKLKGCGMVGAQLPTKPRPFPAATALPRHQRNSQWDVPQTATLESAVYPGYHAKRALSAMCKHGG